MAEPTKGDKVLHDQFTRDLSHILIPKDTGKGPLITIGDVKLQFMEKAPVDALNVLISSDNRINGMREYISMCLESDSADFTGLLHQIDIEGLSEIINALGEGYTAFQEKS